LIELLCMFSVVWYGFSELMQRVFKYGDIDNTDLTQNKELNI